MPDLFDTIEQPRQAVTHDCLACGKHHADAREVTLHDGRAVSNYSEEWRRECEARAILNLPKLEKRQAILSNIERHRGAQAAEELRDVMVALWNARMAEKLRA